jgi:hypothetical protein
LGITAIFRGVPGGLGVKVTGFFLSQPLNPAASRAIHTHQVIRFIKAPVDKIDRTTIP